MSVKVTVVADANAADELTCSMEQTVLCVTVLRRCCRADVGRLRRQNARLGARLVRLSAECRELCGVATQQSGVHASLRRRLATVDDEAQRAALQRLDVLAQHAVLLRDRHQLTTHVDFLHGHLLLASRPAPADDTGRDGRHVHVNSRSVMDDVSADQQQLQRAGCHQDAHDNVTSH